ncbi:hypothetical protein DSO57_1019816 [Entomophthora muscae]|uniref:Uncharacterized protein n=1 Tax=Entomophthora muscae TaxID=34485 RepID=A0ACC2S5X5_9FUNG|nr:hypothetical protein DSO57_1019816 [Entomophthora muscae]
MSVKGGSAMVINGYIFSCNNANWGFKSRHYTCEDRSCPVQLNNERWDLVQTIKGEHTYVMPNTTIACLLKWYLMQVMPTSKDLSPTQLAALVCKYLSPTNLKRVPTVRIKNSSSLKTRAQEQELDLNPGFLWAARPVDHRTACLRFSRIKPLQADTKNAGPCSKTGQTKEIIAPNGKLITAPNEGTETATISFMNLNSTSMINLEPSQERGTGLQPGPMTTTLKQDNQVAKLRFLTNERTPGLSAILLP